MANTLKLGAGKWATGTDTVLAFNDENNNFKPLPFDFSRASSATVVNQSGLIETVGSGEPRIDFQGNTKGALLLEPQRLNYVTQSETFTGYWGLQGASLIADNNVKNPTGNTFSNILNTTTTGTFKSINKNESSAWDSKTLTVSCFAKKITNDYIYFYNIGSPSGVNGTWFNINDGTFGVSGGAWSNEKIENYGNGWYRCSAKITFGTDTNYIYIANSDGNNNANSTIGSQTYIWGTQIEEGSYPTSYMTTQGSAVTRLADSCSQTVPDGVIGQTEGTVYIDFLSVNNFDGSSGNLFQIKEDNNNRINIYFSNGTPRLFGIENSSGLFNQSLSLTTGSVCKFAIKYNSTSTKVFINGSLSHTLNGINNIAFDNFLFSPNNNINYNEIKLYNTALTDQEAIALTQV